MFRQSKSCGVTFSRVVLAVVCRNFILSLSFRICSCFSARLAVVSGSGGGVWFVLMSLLLTVFDGVDDVRGSFLLVCCLSVK